MPRSHKDGDALVKPKSLADCLFPIPDPVLSAELESYRIEWEAINGPTDLTKHYTSMWTPAAQDFLWRRRPREFFNGLPPFVQDFVRGKMEMAAIQGKLDDVDDTYLHLYAQGLMAPDGNSRGR